MSNLSIRPLPPPPTNLIAQTQPPSDGGPTGAVEISPGLKALLKALKSRIEAIKSQCGSAPEPNLHEKVSNDPARDRQYHSCVSNAVQNQLMKL